MLGWAGAHPDWPQATCNMCRPRGSCTAKPASVHARPSSLRPLLPQGTGDVLAQLAAQAVASQQQGFSSDDNHAGVAAGGRQASISVTFDRIAPCLLPEQKQVGGGVPQVGC